MAHHEEEPVPYTEFDPNEMILRDYLALDRTVLANERTWLAYVRTAIGFLLAGGTVLKVFPGQALMQALGILLLGVGIVCLLWGYVRYTRVKSRLKKVLEENTGGKRQDSGEPA